MCQQTLNDIPVLKDLADLGTDAQQAAKHCPCSE